MVGSMSAWRQLVAATRAPGVAWSFSRLGYRQRARSFADDLGDLTGRGVLVTGATSGLGLAAARALARRGARLWLLGRDGARGEAVRAELAALTPAPVVALQVDVGDRGAVRALADRLLGEPIDVLVHNAGALVHERRLVAPRLELHAAVHLAGPYLLTTRLLPALRARRDARVVFVSSGGMYSERLDVAAMAWPPGVRFDGVRAYALVKRAQVELVASWAACEPGVAFHAMHPGWADTPGVATALPRFYQATRRWLRSPDEGADTIVWLAGAEPAPAPSGTFWLDRAPVRRHLLPGTEPPPGEVDALWRWLDEVTAPA